MLPTPRKFALCAAIIVAGLAAIQPAHAADSVMITVRNDTGLAASDLHVRLSGAGGTVIVDPLTVFAPGCPVPSIPSNPPTVTDTVVIDWGVDCVAPGTAVSFIVYTPNGPLGLIDCFWTRFGIPSGPCTMLGFDPFPLGPPNWARKIQVRWFPNGPVAYTKWRRFPGQPCWWRWCCNPWGWCCEARLIRCCFPNRIARLFEVGVWRAITPWFKIGNLPPAYWWEHTTIEPPPDQRINGVVCNVPPEPPNLWHRWDYQLEIVSTDNGGQTWREGADFASSFFDVFSELQVMAPLDPNNPDPNGPPGPFGFSQTIQFVAPNFQRAAQAMVPLLNEINDTLIFEPNPLLQDIRFDTELIQLSLHSISSHMFSGSIPVIVSDPMPYQNLRDGLNNLGNHIIQMGFQLGQPQRYSNAAMNLFNMAEGVDVTYQMVLAGLVQPSQMDLYLWGLLHRFRPNTRHFATGMMSHVRLMLDLQDYHWTPNTMKGAVVILQDMATNQVLDRFREQISDLSQVDIAGLPEGLFDPNDPLSIRVYLKPPTHLSRVVDVPHPADGIIVNLGPLGQGDANGDNCVDLLDLQMVLNDQGMGGMDADFCPPSDVNGDGIVDPNDVTIVQNNLGSCGQELPTAGCPNDPSGQACDTDIDDNCVIDNVELQCILDSWAKMLGQPGFRDECDYVNDNFTENQDLQAVLDDWANNCN